MAGNIEDLLPTLPCASLSRDLTGGGGGRQGPVLRFWGTQPARAPAVSQPVGTGGQGTSRPSWGSAAGTGTAAPSEALVSKKVGGTMGLSEARSQRESHPFWPTHRGYSGPGS